MTDPGEGEKKPAWRRGGARPFGPPQGPKTPPPPPEDRTFFQTPAEDQEQQEEPTAEIAIEGEATLIPGPKVEAPPRAKEPEGQAAPPSIPGVTITRVIGRGGMGIVYEGTQGYLDRRVAVKLLLQSGQGEEFTRRFQREAKILAALSHPNIVSCYQAGVAPDGRCFLVMEYVDGPTLGQWIDERGALEPDQALSICRAMAGALAYAHQSGIIHRDIKPANVLLKTVNKAEGSFPYRPTLADLGLARVSGERPGAAMDLTVSGTVMGSPPTMAPEQFDAPDKVDFRTDIYGLGCVLFHCLTGKLAFPQGSLTSLIARKTQGDPPDPRALRKNLPRELSALVRSMLASKPEDRPASYEALLRKLDEPFATAKPARSKALVGPAVAVSLGLGAWMAVTLMKRGDGKTTEVSNLEEQEPFQDSLEEPPPDPFKDSSKEPTADPVLSGQGTEETNEHSDDSVRDSTRDSIPDSTGDSTSEPSSNEQGDSASGTDSTVHDESTGGEDPPPEPAEDSPSREDDGEKPPEDKAAQDGATENSGTDPGTTGNSSTEGNAITPDLVLPALPAIRYEEKWALLEGANPLAGWKDVAGKGGWSSVEETRNGAQLLLEEGRSAASRGLPHPPWNLSGRVEMISPTRMLTQKAAVLLVLEKGFAIELAQGIEGESARLQGSILRGGNGVWSEVQELSALAIAPMSRSDYKAGAPAEFTIAWDGNLLSITWTFTGTAEERRMEFARADLIPWGAPVGLEIALEVGGAIFSEFVVEGR